jgi:hypothetical protein
MAYPASLLQNLVEGRAGKGRVGADDDALPPGPVPVNHGEQDLIPPIGTVYVARPELGGEAVALLVEDRQLMIADGLEVAVICGLLLRTVDRTLRAVDVEGHAGSRWPGGLMLHQVRTQARQPLIVPLFSEDVRFDPLSVEVSATLVSLHSREASIRNVGSSASRSASLVSSYSARRL